jgi:hypothetical protein
VKKLVLILAVSAAFVAADAQTRKSGTGGAPVLNFSLPGFTPEGNRAWLIRGSEARAATREEIYVTALNMTIFQGDAAGTIDTIFLSADATVRPDDQVVTGNGIVRVINDEFEAAGTGFHFRYAEKEKKVSIDRNVRVTFRAELGNLLN